MHKKFKIVRPHFVNYLTIVVMLFLAISTTMLTCCIQHTVLPERGTLDKEMFQMLSESSAVIETEHGLGSGSIIIASKTASFVLTCFHVIEDPFLKGGNIFVTTHRGVFEATLYDINISDDLALLYIPSQEVGFTIPLAKKEPENYSKLYLMGAPHGRAYSAAIAILTSKYHRSDLNNQILWAVTGFTYPGLSGGIAANVEGELVCVPSQVDISGKWGIIPELGSCIPLPTIKKFLVKTPLMDKIIPR